LSTEDAVEIRIDLKRLKNVLGLVVEIPLLKMQSAQTLTALGLYTHITPHTVASLFTMGKLVVQHDLIALTKSHHQTTIRLGKKAEVLLSGMVMMQSNHRSARTRESYTKWGNLYRTHLTPEVVEQIVFVLSHSVRRQDQRLLVPVLNAQRTLGLTDQGKTGTVLPCTNVGLAVPMTFFVLMILSPLSSLRSL